MRSVSLHLGQRRQVSSSSPSLPFQMPFIHQICDISFTHWLSCFSGKQESKTVVLIISRILKEKKKFPNSTSSYYQGQWNSQSVSSLYFLSTKELSSTTKDGSHAPYSSRAESEPLAHQGRPDADNFKQEWEPSQHTLSSWQNPYVSPYAPPTSSGFPFGFLTNTCLQGMCPRTIASHEDLSNCPSRGEKT